jgi:hypothetical protein
MTASFERNPQAGVANRTSQLGTYKVFVTGIDMSKASDPHSDPRGIAQTVDTFARIRQIGVSTMIGSGAYPQAGETWIIDQSLGTWTFLSRQVSVLPEVWDGWSLATSLEQLGFIKYDGPAEPPRPFKDVNTAIQNVTATANITTYASMPTPIISQITFDPGQGKWLCLFVLTAYINISVNNTEVALDVNVTGHNSIPAGSHTENRLHVLGKSPVAANVNQVVYAILVPGTTQVEVQHAGGACAISDVAFSFIPLLLLPPSF